jgi:hypothetical protein
VYSYVANRLDIVRQLPSWSVALRVTTRDGASAEVNVSGPVLEQVAAALQAAAEAQKGLATTAS